RVSTAVTPLPPRSPRSPYTTLFRSLLAEPLAALFALSLAGHLAGRPGGNRRGGPAGSRLVVGYVHGQPCRLGGHAFGQGVELEHGPPYGGALPAPHPGQGCR